MYFIFIYLFITFFPRVVFTSCSGDSVQEEEIMATLLGSESQQHTGRKKRNGNGNIVAKFADVRITGKGFNRGTQVRENTVVFRDKRRRRVARSRPGSRAAAEAEHRDASPGVERGDAVARSLPRQLRLQKLTATIFRITTTSRDPEFNLGWLRARSVLFAPWHLVLGWIFRETSSSFSSDSFVVSFVLA